MNLFSYLALTSTLKEEAVYSSGKSALKTKKTAHYTLQCQTKTEI
jgi:hypothetical protein